MYNICHIKVSTEVVPNLWVMTRLMTHDPTLGHLVFCLDHEPISNNNYLYLYIIVYIILLYE